MHFDLMAVGVWLVGHTLRTLAVRLSQGRGECPLFGSDVTSLRASVTASISDPYTEAMGKGPVNWPRLACDTWTNLVTCRNMAMEKIKSRGFLYDGRPHMTLMYLLIHRVYMQPTVLGTIL